MNMAPPRRDNKAVWWILGIVVGGIVIMIVFGLALAGMFLRRVHVNGSDKNVDIQTPVGELKVNTDSAHSTGLPVYPGAVHSDDQDKSAQIELNSGDSGVGLAVENYTTRDSLGQVLAWYQTHLSASFKRENPQELKNDHEGNVDHKADVAFVDDRGDGARVVALTKRGDGVSISLVRVGKRETQ
jgi:hypothetical protein